MSKQLKEIPYLSNEQLLHLIRASQILIEDLEERIGTIERQNK